MSKSRTSSKKKAKKRKKPTKAKKTRKAKKGSKARKAPSKRRQARSRPRATRSKPPEPLVPGGHTGLLLVLSGPSGAGKSTLARRMSAAESSIWRSVSMTTRPPRGNEMIGIDYLFVTHDEFQRAVSEKTLLEHASVHNEFYGTPRGPVVERLAQGRDVLLEIDVNGAIQVRDIAPEAILLYVAPLSRSVLERRLRERHSEDEASIQARLAAADVEMQGAREYDYYVVNDDLDRATSELLSIISAERCRLQRRPEIVW